MIERREVNEYDKQCKLVKYSNFPMQSLRLERRYFAWGDDRNRPFRAFLTIGFALVKEQPK